MAIMNLNEPEASLQSHFDPVVILLAAQTIFSEKRQSETFHFTVWNELTTFSPQNSRTVLKPKRCFHAFLPRFKLQNKSNWTPPTPLWLSVWTRIELKGS